MVMATARWVAPAVINGDAGVGAAALKGPTGLRRLRLVSKGRIYRHRPRAFPLRLNQPKWDKGMDGPSELTLAKPPEMAPDADVNPGI